MNPAETSRVQVASEARVCSRTRPELRTRVIGFLALYLLAGDCRAYIDPNAGGWLFQVLFPVLIFIGGVWTLFWRRVTALFRALRDRLFKRGADPE